MPEQRLCEMLENDRQECGSPATHMIEKLREAMNEMYVDQSMYICQEHIDEYIQAFADIPCFRIMEIV